MEKAGKIDNLRTQVRFKLDVNGSMFATKSATFSIVCATGRQEPQTDWWTGPALSSVSFSTRSSLSDSPTGMSPYFC